MTLAIRLPRAPEQSQPESLQVLNSLPELAGADSLQQVLHALDALALPDNQPLSFLGSLDTPALYWFAARTRFPSATLWLLQGNGAWLKLTASGRQEQKSHAAPEKPLPSPTESVDPEAWGATASVSDVDVKKVVEQTFRNHAWNLAEAERMLQEQLHHFSGEPALLQELQTAARHGRHAFQMGLALNKKLQAGASFNEVAEWIEQQANSQPHRVVKHLKIEMQKKKNWHNTQHQKRQAARQFKITLPNIALTDGLHPQSLRALPPSSEWQILIDESGKKFSLDATELNETDRDLGRIVALALPANSNLLPLSRPHHASDLTHAEIQKLLLAIINSNSGILGATVRQDLLTHNWISAVAQLARWALLMLPVNGLTRVRILIERRDVYNSSTALTALAQTLENELKLLAPGRFAQLQLQLEIMSKNHPLNGYVDVIANAWASPDDIKRKMLARTHWRNHCLLQNSDMQLIERFYQRVSNSPELSAEDWFELCQLAALEPEHSLLRHLLIQTAERAQQDPSFWQQCVDVARTRVSTKRFTANSLLRALEWLESTRSGHALPGLLELQLKSLQLAAKNHLGLSDLQLVSEVLKRAQSLLEESAPDACEAILRVAISATNIMDFTSPQPFIEQWLQQPVAAVGLLNHGKLHSTLGQLAAFNNQPTRAKSAFDAALACFNRLSDPQKALRESHQTLIYRSLMLMDDQDPQTRSHIMQLAEQATHKTGDASIKAVARSGDPLRFDHYLLLRWLVVHQDTTAERNTYLTAEPEWQFGEGHPWMLILAYRGWLLAENGAREKAGNYFNEAIEACMQPEQGPLLHWMARVLSALAQSLQLPVEKLEATSQQLPAVFPIATLATLAAATTHQARLEALGKALPFNFH